MGRSDPAGISSASYSQLASEADMPFFKMMTTDMLVDIRGDLSVANDVYFGSTMTFGNAVADTLTVAGPMTFSDGLTTYAIKIGSLSSTTPGSGVEISDTVNYAVDVHADDNNVAIDSAKTGKAIRGRAMYYNTTAGEAWGIHGLAKLGAVARTANVCAGIVGAFETTGTCSLATGSGNTYAAGVMGRVGTGGSVTIGSGTYVACVLAFGNNANSNAFTNTGYHAFHACLTDVGTAEVFDVGLCIEDDAATTGIQLGNATTGILLDGDFTTGISLKAEANADDGILIDAETSMTITDGIEIKGAGTVTTGINIGVAGTITTGVSITQATTTGFNCGDNCTTGLSIGNATTGILIDGNLTTGISVIAEENMTDGLKIDAESAKTITDGIEITGAGTVTNGINFNVSGTLTTGIDVGTATTGIAFTGTYDTALQLTSATMNIADDDLSLIEIGSYDTAHTITGTISANTFAQSINIENQANPSSGIWLVASYNKIKISTAAQANTSAVSVLVRADIKLAMAAFYGIQSHVKFTAGTAQDCSSEVIGVSAQIYGACAAGTGLHWGMKSDLRHTNCPTGVGSSACIFLYGTVSCGSGIRIGAHSGTTMAAGIAINPAGNITDAIHFVGNTNVTNFVSFAGADGCIAAETGQTCAGDGYKIKIKIAGTTCYLRAASDWT